MCRRRRLHRAFRHAGASDGRHLRHHPRIRWGGLRRFRANGGQVLPGFKWDPDELVAKYGNERGERIAAFAGSSPDIVYGLIERYGIACGLRRNCGWLNAAVNDAAFALQKSRAEQWVKRGAKVRAVDREETREFLGSGRYRGAMLDERAGALNPLAFVRGLAEAVQKHGAKVYCGTHVTGLERMNGRWRVSTADGVVQADTVLLCTNGYTDALWPGLARELVPIHSLQVATQPLSDKVRATILPRGHVVSDTQRILLYFRLDDEGRLVMGGRGSLGETNRDSLFRFVEDAACRLFPQIGTPTWQYRWAGKVALTVDHMPRVHELAPGLRTCVGYNGRGVAMATAMGRELGKWVRTGDTMRCRCRRARCDRFRFTVSAIRCSKASRHITGCVIGSAGGAAQERPRDRGNGTLPRRRDRRRRSRRQHFYHLALRGLTDSVLLERNELTSGSTWHAAGNCPNFSTSQAVMAMQAYSTSLYAQLGERVGYPFNYTSPVRCD